MDQPNLYYPDPYDFVKLHHELIRLEQSAADRDDGVETVPQEWKLPTNTVDWTPWITLEHTEIVGEGGFGTVYFGKWTNLPLSVGHPPPVVVKVVRVERNPSQAVSNKRYKRLRREITVWNDLRHPHIVPFVGICRANGRLPALISPYMKDGDVITYLNSNPSANKGVLIIGIALGLEFFHNSKIVHGDLKAANVLVNKRGWSCLVDFGVSRMISEWDTTLWRTTAHQAQGTVRWQAPELVDGTQTTITAEGDVYAWAMTSLEIWTGLCPFSEYKHDIAVLNAVITGQPAYQRPDDIVVDDFAWHLYLKCWKKEPKSRPSIEEIVRKVMICTHPFPTMLDSNGRSILSLLAGSDIEGVVKLIKVQSRISPALIQAWRQLPLICGVETFLQYDSESADKEDIWGKTPIYYAAKCGFLQCVQMLLAQGVDRLSCYDEDVQHLLYLACEQGCDEVVRFLLRNHNPFSPSLLSRAFCAAVLKGTLSITQILLDFGVNVDARLDPKDYIYPVTPLQLASAEGHENIVRLLLDMGAGVNVQGGCFGSALQIASYEGRKSIVQLLLEQGADVHAEVGFYGNALQAASYKGHGSIAQLLLNEGADVNAQGGYFGSALQAASYEGRKSIVQLLLEQGADVHAEGGFYGNALQAASYKGHESIVRLLLERGVDVHASGGFYGNALQAASSQCHQCIVQLLVDRGALRIAPMPAYYRI